MPSDTLTAPALTGSFTHLPVPDLLRFLALSRVTGQLIVCGATDVVLWWREGRLLLGESAAEPPLDDVVAARGGDVAAVIGERLLDAVFQLLVLPDATFAFHADVPPPLEAEPTTADEVLDRASDRIERWRVVASTIPSTAVRVAAARRLPPGTGSVTLSAAEFELVVALGAGCSVAELAQRLGTGGFEVCERVHDLVCRGVLEVASGPDPGGWG